MALRAGHAAERVRQPGGYSEDGEHLNQVGEWRGVLEWMSAVGIEEPTAVRAPLLDDLLRSHWALRNCLIVDGVHRRLAAGIQHRLSIGSHFGYLLRLDQFCRVVWLQILRNSLPDQCQRTHHTERKQHPKCGTDQIDPEVANCVLLTTHDAADEGNGERNANGR